MTHADRVAPISRFRGDVEWAELDRWAPPIVLFDAVPLPSGWRVLALGDMLKRVTAHTRVEPSREYPMAGVRWYGEGLFHRETARGSDLSTNRVTPLAPGALIYNRLFAWKGAFAVVGEEHADLFVSNEFPQFEVDAAMAAPEYLMLFLTRGRTLRSIGAASTGSAAVSRSRLDEQAFLRLRLALPPLSEQRSALDSWREVKRRLSVQRRQGEKLRVRSAERFLTELGLPATASASDSSRSFLVDWSRMGRWGVRANYLARFTTDLTRGRYAAVELGEIALSIQYGTSEKANARGAGFPVLRINNIKDGLIRTDDLKHVPLSSAAASSLMLRDEDILVVRTSGSRDLVGTFAVFHQSGEFVFASYLIRIRVDRARANPDFVALFLNSSLGREQIDTLSRKIMQNNINSSELRSLLIPLPPVNEQTRLAEEATAEAERVEQRLEAAVEAVGLLSARLEAFVYGHQSPARIS